MYLNKLNEKKKQVNTIKIEINISWLGLQLRGLCMQIYDLLFEKI